MTLKMWIFWLISFQSLVMYFTLHDWVIYSNSKIDSSCEHSLPDPVWHPYGKTPSWPQWDMQAMYCTWLLHWGFCTQMRWNHEKLRTIEGQVLDGRSFQKLVGRWPRATCSICWQEVCLFNLFPAWEEVIWRPSMIPHSSSTQRVNHKRFSEFYLEVSMPILKHSP